ncbi:MAG: hypothetical protein GY865_17755 [candidate division Zixibacteria bacterium]|nr:hypothetical protein [candidate division Zixibacteria bacterium]
MSNQDKIASRIQEITGWKYAPRVEIVTDTTEWDRIIRGNVFRLNSQDFVVAGNQYERRFGISDQPKHWVFDVYDLKTGEQKIIKTVFHEEFNVHIGLFKIHCFRSPEKEGDVLDLVRDDLRFMQGYTTLDDKKNKVRVIDYIKGESFFNYVVGLKKDHRQYFEQDLPQILWNLIDCIEAIQFLHHHKTCHGDIRNDHILIDAETGKYRWIDFDLNQYVSDFDIWSIGNIINYAVGKGITNFKNILRDAEISEKVKESLVADDSSAFYEYRIMNLKKLYPYIPPKLNNILMHFTIRPKAFYESIDQFLGDYYEMLRDEFPQGKPKEN